MDRAARRRLWGRELTILPQEPWLALDPTDRVRTQVAEGFQCVRGQRAIEAAKSAASALASLGLARADRKLPNQLSGGMAQRVALLAARAGGASIVIADEPTKGLDAEKRDMAVDLLRSQMEDDGALLVITHDITVPRRLGGQVAIMFEGRIVESGPVEQVMSQPSHDYTRRLIAADPSSWPAIEKPAAEATAIVKAAHLAKSRGGTDLFRDLSLDIVPGRITGVVGPSGSGKSTFGDMLLGLLEADAGSVWRDRAIAKQRFQKLYQDPPAAFAASVSIRTSLLDMVRLHGLDEALVHTLMQRLRLSSALLDRLPTAISGGELQRFALLRVLLLEPAFPFADEPTSRLDLITQKEIVDLLVEFAHERGCAVVIVSHDLELVGKIADEVIEIGDHTSMEVISAAA
jgi:ABC-type glutathione transport system ATPase component